MDKPIALVTGGSAGIGYEIARLLAEDGYDLIITGSSSRVEEAAESLRNLGVEVIAVRSDLSTFEGNEALLETVTQLARVPDVLVLNAGIATGGASFTDIPLQKHMSLITLNSISPVILAHALVPKMVERGHGKILLVSSLSAGTPTPFEGVYGPSKAFLTSFGHGLHEELRGTGVEVTIMHPGATATEFHTRAGMGDTAFGDNSWKNDPSLVAAQGYEAMKAGVTSLVTGDEATKNVINERIGVSEEEKARKHAEMARPKK